MMDIPARQIFVCVKSVEPRHCLHKGAGELLRELEKAIAANNLQGRVTVRPGPCIDVCDEGPAVMCYDGEKSIVNGPVKGLRSLFVRERGEVIKKLRRSDVDALIGIAPADALSRGKSRPD